MSRDNFQVSINLVNQNNTTPSHGCVTTKVINPIYQYFTNFVYTKKHHKQVIFPKYSKIKKYFNTHYQISNN